MYKINDNNGTIHSGTLSEMEIAFAAMTNDKSFFNNKKEFKEAIETYATEWSGDLELVEVIKIFK